MEKAIKYQIEKEKVRQKAKEWQSLASITSMSYSEIIEWQELFTKLAKKYGLIKEFKENGIL